VTADAKSPPGFSLKRWSQRKLEAARAADSKTAAAPPAASGANAAPAVPVAAPPAAPATVALPQLPDVNTLTFESDFSAFFQPKVDESLKRAALRKLFSDPRFNVMDGLDIYIDDYTKSDPIPPEMLAKLVHGRRLLGLPPEPAPGDPGGAAPDGPSTAATVATAEPDAPVPATAPDAAASNPVGEPAANNAPDEPAPR
jgi:hypothetical protein